MWLWTSQGINNLRGVTHGNSVEQSEISHFGSCDFLTSCNAQEVGLHPISPRIVKLSSLQNRLQFLWSYLLRQTGLWVLLLVARRLTLRHGFSVRNRFNITDNPYSTILSIPAHALIQIACPAIIFLSVVNLKLILQHAWCRCSTPYSYLV